MSHFVIGSRHDLPNASSAALIGLTDRVNLVVRKDMTWTFALVRPASVLITPRRMILCDTLKRVRSSIYKSKTNSLQRESPLATRVGRMELEDSL